MVVSPLILTKFLSAAATGAALLNVATGISHAELVPAPDVVRTIDTVDGWRMTLALTEVRVDAVRNMAVAPLTKEGYLSGRVTLTIEGEGAMPVTTGQLVLGAQLGCQVDVSEGLDLGVDFDTDLFDDVPVIGLGPDIGSTLHSGGITTVGLGTKSLKGRTATISVLAAHVSVDECGGVVTARLFTSAQIGTDTADDSINLYSAVLPL
ncbi:MspA family porin [Mycobacterium sp. 21AC1]|uniref:MspA family porin n=1 Tax=[Mycobacterium] appelbergii TaxID=2939269 RepID=UPI0029391F83|nr:MspA family porin [Mycobacterium sp. 21AC1]MDV3128711.1 MspA family porin [Mycobacterium sp. 21AC1]